MALVSARLYVTPVVVGIVITPVRRVERRRRPGSTSVAPAAACLTTSADRILVRAPETRVSIRYLYWL